MVYAAQGHFAHQLLNDLMDNYSNALRPVEDTDKTLNVTLQVTLSQIKDMVSTHKSVYCCIIVDQMFKRRNISEMILSILVRSPIFLTLHLVCLCDLILPTCLYAAIFDLVSKGHFL